MVLNIDLGTLYIKVAVIDKKVLVASEVIRLDREVSMTVIEVLLKNIIETYSKRFNVKRINIIPNQKYMEFELLDYEAITESKYEKVVADSIKSKKRYEKSKLSEDSSALIDMSDKKDKEKDFNKIPFNKPILGNTIFHNIEFQDLTTSKILVEYINSDYLRSLMRIARKMGNHISIISPVKSLKHLPFPKTNRIIVNYGESSCIIAVIERIKGKDVIKELEKKTFKEETNASITSLIEKHQSSSIEDKSIIFKMILDDVKNYAKVKYPTYQLCLIGGNADYLQRALFIQNKIDTKICSIDLPVVTENLLLPSLVTEVESDMIYDNLGLHLKNSISNILNLSADSINKLFDSVGDIALVLLTVLLINSYYVNSKYIHYSNYLNNIKQQLTYYNGDGTNPGRITLLEDKIAELQSGSVKTYYHIGELLNSLASPLEIDSIVVNGENIEVVAYAENTALVEQFIETVKAKQFTNEFTKFSLEESDIYTVFRDGRKMDRVLLRGRIY